MEPICENKQCALNDDNYEGNCHHSLTQDLELCPKFTEIEESPTSSGSATMAGCAAESKAPVIREDYKRLLEIQEEIRDSLSATIKIDHGQVLNIVVADLLEKYKAAVKRKDREWQEPFRKVLRFYLDEEELNMLLAA